MQILQKGRKVYEPLRPIRIGRFVLARMTEADGDKYHALSNNPNVMKYVTGYALSREESDKMLNGFLAEYEDHSYLGRYLIEDLESGMLIGVAKLDQIGADIEIGYRVMEEFWGRGVATEIAKGLIRFAKSVLKARKVIAFVNVDNKASIRVLEKAGMTNRELIEDIDEVKFKFIYTPQANLSMKKVLYVILGLIAIVLIVALFVPKDYAVEREIVINKPRTEVYDYLESLKNQNNWSVWGRLDPNMKLSFKGADRTVGFVYKWEGNDEVGTGEQEIKKITKGERIDTELRFLKPMESTSNAHMITEDAGPNQTKVKWGFEGSMAYPMNLMLLFMNMDEMIGKDFSEGLKNLKEILEK